eukprot:Colp12_sorted_trinity150504_noHs@22949
MASTTTGHAMLSISSEHRFRAENLPFGIDVWYRRLKNETFATVFEPLSREQAESIIAFYETRYNSRSKLTGEHISILLDLEIRLHDLLTKHFNQDGAFLRLSDRSPKDGEPLDRKSVMRKYESELADLKTKYPEIAETANLKMCAIGRVNYLQVQTGADAMSLVLTSERVFSDCLDFLQYGEPVMIALREFEPELTLENEFRAFIYQGKLTAISQYDHYTYYPSLAERKQHLQELIVKEWSRLHPLVGEDSYTIDFGYLPSRDVVKMIEISPFLPCTGSACFSWKKDWELLHGRTSDEIIFRVNESARHGIDDLIEANWVDRWSREEPPFYDLYSKVIPAGSTSTFLERAISSLKSVASKLFSQPNDQNSELNAYLQRRAELIEIYKLPTPRAKKNFLFVYGTLKKGFHWQQKFLSRADYIGKAMTNQRFKLVVGNCGVPYLLGDVADAADGSCAVHQLQGELWAIDDVELAGLDDYEGVSKKYYDRWEIRVILQEQQKEQNAWVYILPSSTRELRDLPSIPEYTIEIHDERYRPIQHIQIKQQRYLGTLDSYNVQT